LEEALAMKLPTKETSEREDVSGDCAICYAYHITTCVRLPCDIFQ
jgi:hypothetical protein